MKALRTLLFVLTIGVTLLAAGACRNTLRGAGRDMNRAGDKIQDAVN